MLLQELFNASKNAGKGEPIEVTRAQLLPCLEDWWRLPSSSVPCLASAMPPSAAGDLTSWSAYYAARGLPSDSPAALVMHCAVSTLSAVLQQMELAGTEDGRQHGRRSPLTVLVLGADQEIELWPSFLELGCALPHVAIEIHFIGPAVPEWLHRQRLQVKSPKSPACERQGCSCSAKAQQFGNGSGEKGSHGSCDGVSGEGYVVMGFWKGLYHELVGDEQVVAAGMPTGPPHVVVGINAGK